MRNQSSVPVETVRSEQFPVALGNIPSLMTDLKLALYSAAVSASAAFVQREVCVYGASFAIVFALWRSLAPAFLQFLRWPEKTSKFDSAANNGSRARISVTRFLTAVIPVFCVLGFSIARAHAQAGTDEPFGLSTIPAAETAIAATWKQLLVEINNDLSIVAKCRKQSQSCSSPAAIELVSIAKEAEGHDGLAQIGHFNRAANFAIRVLDTTHADDEWRSPLAILSRGSGDCKHYAVLKYAMLKELGLSADALKIIIVEVRSSHQLHAILAVRAEKGHWLLLDNRTLMLVESSMALGYYDPLYELDQNGARQFALPPRSPQVAQSLRPTQAP
jgi:predicted transglutaminase-like cysteine proteinase